MELKQLGHHKVMVPFQLHHNLMGPLSHMRAFTDRNMVGWLMTVCIYLDVSCKRNAEKFYSAENPTKDGGPGLMLHSTHVCHMCEWTQVSPCAVLRHR